MIRDEKSCIHSVQFRPAYSELSIIQITDTNVLQDIKFQNSDLEHLKNALQSVYPTLFSIQNSNFILFSPKYVKLQNRVISILMVQMKNNANFDITDKEVIDSLGYEIQVKIIHRETQKLLNENNYCMLRQDWNKVVQDLQLYQYDDDKNSDDLYDLITKNNWTIVKSKQISDEQKDEQLIKEFVREHTKPNNIDKSVRIYALEFTEPESLNLIGTYDIYLSFRNVPIIQSQIQAVPILNLNIDVINKLNKTKLNQQQLYQKIKIRDHYKIIYQSNGQFIVELSQLKQLEPFKQQSQQNTFGHRKLSFDLQQEQDDEYSIISSDELSSIQTSPKREIQVESDINDFIKKLFGTSQRDDLTTIEIQSTKGSKTIVESTDEQIQVNGKQFIQKYNEQNVIQCQVRIFSLNIITGSCILFFNKDIAMQSVNQIPDNGIHVFNDCITFSSLVQYFQVKFVQSKDSIDVYCNNQFLGNYEYQNLYIKFCSKNTEIDLN